MSNMDEVIDKMLSSKLDFDYKKKDNVQDWYKLLGKMPKYNEYDYEKELKKKYLVEALPTFVREKIVDGDIGRVRQPGERWVVNKNRKDVLLGNNKGERVFVKVVKEIEN